MNTSDINSLLEKYLNGTSTEQENAALETWYMRYENKSLADVADQVRIEQLDRIRKQVAQYSAPARTYKLWPRIAVAAAAVAAITLGVWLYYTPRHPDAGQDPGSAQYATDIAPGKNGAMITLANGKVIELSDAKTGVVVGNGLKYSDSTLVIQSNSEGSNGFLGTRNDKGGENVMQLTASTAKGQTYQFTLPDGTKVWLNADSKISFPSQFSGKERKILLEGEGYFEVSKDKAHPFIVATDRQEVEVLGTHFNINAYKDESNIKTTLLEGSVRVYNLPEGGKDYETLADRMVLLKPNQQSILTDANGIRVKQVDTEEAVAWKNGKFRFNNANLEDVMKQLARWYDVEIEYPHGIPDERFSGGINRNAKASEALEILKFTKVNFKIQGKKIIVEK